MDSFVEGQWEMNLYFPPEEFEDEEYEEEELDYDEDAAYEEYVLEHWEE